MKSAQDIARVSNVDRELLELRIRHISHQCSAGNLDAVAAYFSEDISYQMIGNWNMFPFPGPVRGKAAARQALGGIFTCIESLGSTIHDIIVDCDRVAVRRTARLRNRGTSRTDDVAVVGFIRFRDGLITDVTELLDSQAVARLEEG